MCYTPDCNNRWETWEARLVKWWNFLNYAQAPDTAFEFNTTAIAMSRDFVIIFEASIIIIYLLMFLTAERQEPSLLTFKSVGVSPVIFPSNKVDVESKYE